MSSATLTFTLLPSNSMPSPSFTARSLASVVANFTNPAYAKFADVGGRVIAAQKTDDFASNIIGGVKRALDTMLPRRAPHEEFCEEYCPEEW